MKFAAFFIYCVSLCSALADPLNESNSDFIGPSSVGSYAWRGFEAATNGLWSNAISNLNQAVQLDPKDADSFINLGHAYLKSGELQKAISSLSQAITLNTDEASAAYDLRGIAYAKSGDLDRAMDDFKAGIKLAPNDPRSYYNQGLTYIKKGSFENAVPCLDEALRIAPNQSGIWSERGIAFFELKKWTNALSDFQKAIELDKKNAVALVDLAWLFATCPDASMRNGQEATKLATKASELSGWKNPNCIATLAAAYAEAGNFPEAIKWQQKSIDLRPSNFDLSLAQKALKLYKDGQPYHEDSQ